MATLHAGKRALKILKLLQSSYRHLEHQCTDRCLGPHQAYHDKCNCLNVDADVTAGSRWAEYMSRYSRSRDTHATREDGAILA